MQLDTDNEHFKLAWHYVTETMRPIYLTGKAGTGKTTFLKYLKEHGTKNMIIVAPTGVAAINAGGVTMHSMFQLPLKPFVADMPMGFGRNESIADRHSLLKNLRMQDRKRKLIRELELLVIDEVSMMRADHLEAIHYVLRSVRKNREPFGGVQVLFIGDLYQLPPVVVDSERSIIEHHYASPYFFDAPVMKDINPLYIELKKVYRQKDIRFIDLLNRVRSNQLNESDYKTLEACYDANFIPGNEKYITVTSHNHKAEAINRTELDRLNTPAFTYEGIIEGDFGDKQLPTDRFLVLKEGAQVMFIRNDNTEEKQYYNGKLATVVSLHQEEIMVQFPDASKPFKVPREIWENVTYDLDEEKNQIEERVAGTFTQFPLRLAWAITIHKSQGLTFERAIIDAGSSFAPGQVYVALSRCTSLEGMKLRSRIGPSAILSDLRVQGFAQREVDSSLLQQQLAADQKVYQIEKFRRLLSFDFLIEECREVQEATLSAKTIGTNADIVSTVSCVQRSLEELHTTAQKFLPEIHQLIFRGEEPLLYQRLEKALNYFTKSIFDDVILPFKKIRDILSKMKGVKGYDQVVSAFQESIWNKLQRLHKTTYNGRSFELNKDYLHIPKKDIRETNTSSSKEDTVKVRKIVKEKKPKLPKGESAKETLRLFQSGKSVEEIAALRSLATTTIEGHLFQFVVSGELQADRFLSYEQKTEILLKYESNPALGIKQLKEFMQDKFTYFQIKLALMGGS